ncbi:hypothetical protein HLRTI_001621 [Halorhabdus tiamatea SARL4B]|uniref:Uncharacterized protein n=1 Tax=Halorhabdus tiamatea SARL4B TaxID=1033806 RepID=U2E2T6_9EURY|nr:hypothetical protein HLRTI_001621 [Halorhabdus tiamatea SARL4B]
MQTGKFLHRIRIPGERVAFRTVGRDSYTVVEYTKEWKAIHAGKSPRERLPP